MTAGIMAVFIGFFLAIGLGFDFFYLNFNPGAVPEYKLKPAGYYEAQGSGGGNVPYGTIGALLFGLGMAANSVFNGTGMVLRSTKARRAAPQNEKEKRFLNVVEEMATAAGLPVPQGYIIPDPDLNAFAAGINPSKAVIAVTEGLVKSLNREELQGVVAHEMSHIRNYDIRLMTVTATLMGAIALISDFSGRSMRYGRRSSVIASSRGSDRKSGGGLFFIVWLLLVLLAPLISRILAMAISRQREFLADASGAELTRNPLALVSALEKIRGAIMPTRAINNGVAHMCIADPRGSLIEEKTGFTADLLATHPPLEKRILALKVMSYQAGKSAA